MLSWEPLATASATLGVALDTMYTRFVAALRTNFSEERPAQHVLYLDATGCCLGHGITHCEAGCADFVGNVKQSRQTLEPLGLYEGSDKGLPLREHLDLETCQILMDSEVEQMLEDI